GSNIRCFPQCQLLLPSLPTHLPHNDQPSMNPYTDGELDTFGLLQTGIEVSHGSKNSQPSPYCSLGVIFMGLGITEINKQAVTEQLSDMPIVALNNFSTHLLIRPYHVPVRFGVELAGEARGVHHITKQHGQLAAFGFGRGRDDWGGLALRRRD